MVPLRVEPHCQLPSLLVHWSYRERNTHAILYKYGDVCQQMHGDSSLQWLHLGRNSVSEVLSDVRLSTYFLFTVLNTMSRIFRIVLFIVFEREKTCLTFSLCDNHNNIQHSFKKIFGLKQKCFFCYPSNPNKFQISCQRTDLRRQKSFGFLKKCFKSKRKFPIFQM